MFLHVVSYHVDDAIVITVFSMLSCVTWWTVLMCDLSVCCIKVRPTPSSWSLDSVKEGAPYFSDSVGKLLCPPVPPRPPYSGKLAGHNEPYCWWMALIFHPDFWHLVLSPPVLLFFSPLQFSASIFLSCLSCLVNIHLNNGTTTAPCTNLLQMLIFSCRWCFRT